jgi:hypothetical protein
VTPPQLAIRVRGISISRFNRRIHKLYHLTLRIIELLSCLQRDKTAYIIDSMPVQVCKQVRRNRCKKVRGGTFQGYCAAKKEFFFGYRLHLSCNLEGCPVSFRIEPASAHDGQFTEQLTSILPSGSRVAADKGYISAKTEEHLYNLYGVRLVVEKRSNMKPNSKSDNDFIKTNRKRIETLFSQFEKMGLQRIQARTLKGLFIKVHAAILSTLFAFAVQTSN